MIHAEIWLNCYIPTYWNDSPIEKNPDDNYDLTVKSL